MKVAVASFLSGLVFAIGLGLSGMTLPSKVIGFLDVTGHWDPSLGLVMGGALAVLFAVRRFTPARPVFTPSFAAFPPDRLDARLITGAALFGVGWGLSGFCPGPALVSLGTGTTAALIFVPAMILGMAAHTLYERITTRQPRALDKLTAPSADKLAAPSASCG